VDAFQTEPGKMAAVFQDITEKRLAEEALLQSEEKFSKAFKTSPDSININRLSDGLYIDCNEGFTRLTGFTREDVIGKTSLEINIWADMADRKKLVDALKQDGFCENLEADFTTKNGNIIHGLMSAAIIKINGELCILNISRDISERIESEKKMQEAHSQLEQAYEATLQGWARALDLREHETADHSRRVVDFTGRIAVQLGFDEQALINVLRGALLHDLGKVGVPDNILLKPGPLTSDEWVIMRQHPLYAYDLLKEIDYLVGALDIPYCHHEHWDGGGYPRGLKGEEIPLSARIFTIVDVWDALLSDRPYRPAWNKQAVLNYLDEQSGKLFDPEIVKIFIRLIKDETNEPVINR
jgi:PAS domain S-box-containing protein